MLIFGLINIVSCAPKDAQVEQANCGVFSESQQLTYLALGDSYTIGEGVDEDSRWPKQLEKKLMANNCTVASTSVLAQTGWTTRDLIESLNTADLGQFDLVSLSIGVNNQYQGLSFDEFKIEFEELLNASVQLSGDSSRVFVVSIPDYGLTPFGSSNAETIAQELDNYNDFSAQICEERSIPYIDITTISRTLGASNGALASDNLHPSGSQYAAWVEEILPVVLELLRD
ncbi:SGNH/GDSL hydrolase family protein [Chitinophagales bacterium]|nr:SGNH/GDSL hydrolase family protein [Chitinophagales bacterium]